MIRDDPSLETFFNFLKGRDYLNSSWTEELDENRLHIIYLAVRPSCQGRGLAKYLMNTVLDYADQRNLLVRPGNAQSKERGNVSSIWI